MYCPMCHTQHGHEDFYVTFHDLVNNISHFDKLIPEVCGKCKFVLDNNN